MRTLISEGEQRKVSRLQSRAQLAWSVHGTIHRETDFLPALEFREPIRNKLKTELGRMLD
jgi:hypothetical protein